MTRNYMDFIRSFSLERNTKNVYSQELISISKRQGLHFMPKTYRTQHKVALPDLLLKGKSKFTTSLGIGSYLIPVYTT